MEMIPAYCSSGAETEISQDKIDKFDTQAGKLKFLALARTGQCPI